MMGRRSSVDRDRGGRVRLVRGGGSPWSGRPSRVEISLGIAFQAIDLFLDFLDHGLFLAG